MPLARNKAFFLCYYGSQYGCNPKYLSQYITKIQPTWDIIWGFTQPERHKISGIRKVRYLSLRFFYELCTSQVVVANYRMPLFYHRRRGQLYIQTWHSSMRLKAIEADAVTSLSKNYLDMAYNDSQQISILLSGCKKSSDIFKSAFWYNGIISPTGTPRLDILMASNQKLSNEIKNRLAIKNCSHIVLYAPTFREYSNTDVYDIDLLKLKKSFKQRWGGEWQVLVRLHPHMLGKHLKGALNEVVDVTAYDDIQELLLISDVVVTDYSSLMFDFAVTKRPCFLYVPDLDEYLKRERQLYFSLDSLPFPKIRSNMQIDDVIYHFDEDKYSEDVDAFLQQTGSYETGNACENVFQIIQQYTQ